MHQHILPSITASWHAAFTIFQKRFWTFVAIAIIPQILTFGAVYGISSLALNDIKASGTISALWSTTNPLMYATLAAIVLLGIFQLFAAVAVIVAAAKRGQVGVIQAFDEARHGVWSFFVANLLTGVLALLGIVVGYVLVSLVTALLVKLQAPHVDVWFSWLSIIPYFASLLVIYLYIFSSISVVVEKKSALAAMRRSREIIKGQYWHIVLRLLLVNTFLFCIVFGAGFIPYAGGLLAAALAIPFGVIYTFVLFEELQAAHT